MIRITVWHENKREDENADMLKAYPKGMAATIAEFLSKNGFDAKNAYVADAEHGLSDDVLKNTDVLIWWGHCKHDAVSDSIAARVVSYVQKGMGAIFLHSAHMAKPFRWLMGTSCTLRWREAGESERLWVVSPTHPIAEGIPEYFELKEEEMYGEHFDVPNPNETEFLGWFKGGNVFRSGLTYRRGYGNVFYFQPGHETHPIYHDATIQKILCNAAKWAHNPNKKQSLDCPNDKPLEKL